MKMSEMFKGLNEYKVIVDSSLASPTIGQRSKARKCKEEIEGIKVSGQFFNDLSPRQMMAIELAVNNHDALIECLTETIKHTNHYGTCECCDVMVGASGEREMYPDDDQNPHNDHRSGCKVKIAQKLLDSIK